MENKKRGKTGVIVAFILIIGFSGFAGLNYFKAKNKTNETGLDEQRIPVEVAPTKHMDISRILTLTGEIRPFQEVKVFSKVPGQIIHNILLEKGDYVNKGDLVAELEDDTISAKVEEVTAALASAEAGLKQAEANLDVMQKDKSRLEYLYKEKAVARQKLDHIEAQYKAALETKNLAEAQVKQARAGLKQAKILHKDHRIHAPISGFVTNRFIDKGAMTAPGIPIIQISREDVVKIITTVTEKDFPDIKMGMSSEIRVDSFPEALFKGNITLISPSLNPMTRSGEIEIHMENPDRMLRSGMFADIALYLGQRKATVIPGEGLIRMPGTGSYYVYVVDNNKAVQTYISPGIRKGNYVEVVSGLDPGIYVIINGQNRLIDGADILVRHIHDSVNEEGQ